MTALLAGFPNRGPQDGSSLVAQRLVIAMSPATQGTLTGNKLYFPNPIWQASAIIL